MEVVHNNKELKLDTNKKIYECSICSKLFNWSEGSSWYGSYKQQENKPHTIPVFCSVKCSSEYQLNIKTPKP